MKIVLITPPSKLFSTGRDNISEPLGLLYLASMVRQTHDVRIIDAFSEGLEISEVVKRTLAFHPEVVGISTVFSVMMKSGVEIAQEIRKYNPAIRIAFGGNHAHFIAQSLIKEPFVDVIFFGESELSFRNWIMRLESGDIPDIQPGTIIKNNGQVRQGPPQPVIEDLDTLPFPSRDLYISPVNVTNRLSMITSRGCPFACIYCSTCSFWGQKWRSRSAKNIIDEITKAIESNDDNGPLRISFGDDLFTQNPQRVTELCRLIIREQLKVLWGCSARIETVNPDLISLMAKAGCTGIFFGLESGSEKVLKLMKRTYTLSVVKNIFKSCLDSGILPTASFMIGIAYEDREDVQKTIDCIDSLPTSKIQAHIFTIYPGTPIHKSPAKYGITITSDDPELVDMNRKCSHTTEFLKQDEIEQFYKKAFASCQRRSWEDSYFEEIVRKNNTCEWTRFMGDSTNLQQGGSDA